MRDYKVLITEAELMASSPERVHSWLEARAAKADAENMFEHEGDERLEKCLLGRNFPLIDLALARFGLHAAIAKQLFARAQSADLTQLSHARSLRMAVLSNQALSKNAIGGLPALVIDGGDDGLVRWIATAHHNEIAALFENPTVDDSFLCDFLQCEKSWQVMDEERRLLAIGALTRNERIRKPYDDNFLDGWADYSYHKVFDAAWKLAETVPTTRIWAHVLSSLYHRLQRKALSVEHPLDVAKRWYPDPADTQSLECESSANEIGDLGPYQNVRKGLAMLALAKGSIAGNDLLTSDDVALRAGAYASMAMSPAQVVGAYQRDGGIAVSSAVDNPQLWRRPEARQALHDISWQVVSDDKNSDLMAANIFNGTKERMAKEHPDWFKDDGFELEANDKPATKSDIARAVAAIAGAAGQDSFHQIKESTDAVNRRLGWVFWFSLIAMGVSLRHYL